MHMNAPCDHFGRVVGALHIPRQLWDEVLAGRSVLRKWSFISFVSRLINKRTQRKPTFIIVHTGFSLVQNSKIAYTACLNCLRFKVTVFQTRLDWTHSCGRGVGIVVRLWGIHNSSSLPYCLYPPHSTCPNGTSTPPEQGQRKQATEEKKMETSRPRVQVKKVAGQVREGIREVTSKESKK